MKPTTVTQHLTKSQDLHGKIISMTSISVGYLMVLLVLGFASTRQNAPHHGFVCRNCSTHLVNNYLSEPY
jgi:hypothetical protein